MGYHCILSNVLWSEKHSYIVLQSFLGFFRSTILPHSYLISNINLLLIHTAGDISWTWNQTCHRGIKFRLRLLALSWESSCVPPARRRSLRKKMTNSILEIELFYLHWAHTITSQPWTLPIALLRKCACWSLQNSNITLNGLPITVTSNQDFQVAFVKKDYTSFNLSRLS